MSLIQQNTTYSRTFIMISGTDHITPVTGATGFLYYISKNGATFGVPAGTITELSGGWYKLNLTAADTNTLGDLAYHIVAPGCDYTTFVDQVVAFNPFDSVRLGLSALPNAAAASSGGLLILGVNTGGITINASSGNALSLISSTGYGLYAGGGGSAGHAILLQGAGNGHGILSTGGETGIGIYAQGGSSSGSGMVISAQAGNSQGLHCVGFGSGNGLATLGGVTGNGISAIGGSTTGAGIYCIAPTLGQGFRAQGGGTGQGIYGLGGATAPGIEGRGGATSGNGMRLQATGGLLDLNYVTPSTNLPDVGIIQASADKVWLSPTRTLTSGGSGGATAEEVWAYSTRTLTSGGGSSLTAAEVWAHSSRSLTTEAAIISGAASAVWSAGSRSLTTFGTLAADITTLVWAAGSRSLTTFGTLISDIVAATWAAASRTLTAFGFSTSPTPSDIDAIADKVLSKDLSTVSAPASRSLLNAVRFLRNKWQIVGNNLVVKAEDDTTDAWTATVATTESAKPITTLDPS